MAGTQNQSMDAAVARAGAQSPLRFVRYGFVLFLTGAVILAWLSLLTFDPTDPPSTAVYPAKAEVANLVGSVGAHVAYTLRYWFGGGVYMALLFASVAAFILVTGGRINDVPWRGVGLMLLVAAASAAIYLMGPDSANELARGKAGVLGIGLGQILRTHFAPVGAWLLVGIALCLGLMLAADNLVLKLPGFGKKVWQQGGRFRTVVGSLRPGMGRRASPDAAPATNRGAAARSPGVELAEPKPDRRDAEAQGPVVPRLRPPLPKPSRAAGAAQARPVAPATPPKPANAGTGARGKTDFVIPSTDLLIEPSTGYLESQGEQADQKKLILQQTLNDFHVEAEVVGYMTGPVITLFELSLAPGVKVSQVSNLSADIARSLAVPGVRVVSPLPGRDTIGIEVPNLDKEIVRIKELMDLAPCASQKMLLPLYLGKDASGEAIVSDLADMPHILIAGTTGSGKSVCINAILMSMLLTRTPRQVRLILADPKMVEMAAFEDIPHLLCPIVNDMRKAEDILEWAATKMDERYEVLKEAGVKNITAFNRLTPREIHKRFEAETDEDRAHVQTFLPHYVIIIDELADLMMTSSKEVESHIIRIAQKARAVGIHLVLATQRPSVNVVTGLIKSNMPCRISFRVASRQESRIVLDQNGADVLLGRGDMLFLKPGTSDLIRAQGAYAEESEIRSVVQSLRQSARPGFNEELMSLKSASVGDGTGERDELFDRGVEIVLATQRGSVSLLQRRLQVGYSRASRIIDQMADAGLLGEYKGSQARECTMTLEEWEELKKNIADDQSGASAADGEPTIA